MDAVTKRSVADFLEALGGAAVVARALKPEPGQPQVPSSTVSSWKDRGSIPPGRWVELVTLAQARGVKWFTYEALALAHAEGQGVAA